MEPGPVNRLSLQKLISYFFFQAEDGIRDLTVTGVQTCALPISSGPSTSCWERSYSCCHPDPSGVRRSPTVPAGYHQPSSERTMGTPKPSPPPARDRKSVV